MRNTGYKITEWVFFFEEKNKEDLKKILHDNKNKDLLNEFVTWKLITVFLPLVTFLLVLVLNIITNLYETEKYFSFLNNGSLPIISFGVLTSGMPYLLEQLESFPEYHVVRRRVMSVALFFLFLSASLYILQTLSVISNNLSCLMNFILLILSIYVFFFSSSIGYKMFILQTKNIKDFGVNMVDKVEGLQNALSDL
ncbi:hypothetical protein [Flavobacterium psychrolimnae]|uniref:Uncharacterized protein n=1 Tax=Flavobacterium psychrolimnae TaxID=249351 RepID=A0A366AX75_9FLAO|nr:hypothetical protein [Flavobacterium psychrolimnae]RBN49470.1 hypothetical protein DR980_13595 [Flavobacterium psychrolimnae]